MVLILKILLVIIAVLEAVVKTLSLFVAKIKKTQMERTKLVQ